MAKKNILAYFNTPEQAEGAAAKLRALRAADLSIDRFDSYPGEGVEVRMNPITGDFDGLGGLTLGGDFSGNNAAILAAADPGASGMSDGGEGGVTGKDILLTAVVDESIHERALQVVRDAGGLV